MQSHIHKSTIAELNRLYQEFLETGIVLLKGKIYPERLKEKRNLIRATSMLRAHFRAVAKELKRPFVLVQITEGDYEGYWVALVEFPRSRELEPVAAPLRLLDAADTRRHRSVCTFSFTRKTRPVLLNWLDLCRTHPAIRQALQLPRKVRRNDAKNGPYPPAE